MAVDETANQDHLIRTSQTELMTLRQEIDTLRKIKDTAIQENRRLQDDLCSATCDCRDSRKELDLYKRQVDDLKTQLQHYVAEVKRFEDLISNKEIERNELLDQFRSLSHEANILENNNHTLENEATQSRVQLSVALDHAGDLERKLENKDSIIFSYEKQIADLTSQIACLEIQLRQSMNQCDKATAELQNMRDLNLQLDNENAKTRRQLRERDEQRLQIDRSVDQLRSDREMLQHTASRSRASAETVERDLNDAKHETTELRMLNQDLQEEVQRLKLDVQELKDKFISTSEQLDMYQEKALEYSQQNKQLRREIANERFRRTRDSESSKIKCVCIQTSSVPHNTRDDIFIESTANVRADLKPSSSLVTKGQGESLPVLRGEKLESPKNSKTEFRRNSSLLKQTVAQYALGQSKNDRREMETPKNSKTDFGRNSSLLRQTVAQYALGQSKYDRSESAPEFNRKCQNVGCSSKCVCLDLRKIHLERRGLSEIQEEQNQIPNEEWYQCRPASSVVNKPDENRFRSSFAVCGPQVKSYVANYTVVHETHRADVPKSYLKQ